MFIDKRLKVCIIEGKGRAIIACENIKKGTIIIKDKPYTLKNKNFKSDMFCILFKILNDDDEIIRKFLNLYPQTLDDYPMDREIKKRICCEFKYLKINDNEKYHFFTKNYTNNQIHLYCAKYICNCFEYNNAPAFLFTGTLLNHSCLPNVVFGEINGFIIFVAVRDIVKNEEIYDNYVDIKLPLNKRKKLLKTQYGFICVCQRCTSDGSKYDNIINNIITYKNNLFDLL